MDGKVFMLFLKATKQSCLWLLFLCFNMIFFSSCGKKNFTPLTKITEINVPKGEVGADFCTLDPSLVDQYLKIIFVIDNSGSNVIAAGGRPPTDPDRSRRYESLKKWLSNRKGSPNEFYTMVEFSGNSTKIPPDLVNSQAESSPFTNDKDFFYNVVATQQASSKDGSATPYKAAMDTVINTIKGDAIKAKKRAEDTGKTTTSSYVVIFLSDGGPTDSTEDEIVALISETLMKLPNQPDYGAFINQLTLNTGYYYIDVDLPDARQILANMAKAGKGQSYSFDRGDIDYDKLTDVFIKKVTTRLTDVIVNNLNTVWDQETMTLEADSDGDFLSDRLEKKLGSNPLLRDSDLNGVSDGVEFLLDSKSRPCKDEHCLPENATQFLGCFDEKTNELLDKDDDGLSDCEERALGTDPERFDSNGDKLPDYLSVKYGVPATKEDSDVPTPPATSVDSDFDGEFNLPEVKVNTPPLIDNKLISKLKPYKYKLQQVSYDVASGVGCYNLGVEDVSFASKNDTLRIYLLENETSQTGRIFVRVVDKKASEMKVHFSKKDFLIKP